FMPRAWKQAAYLRSDHFVADAAESAPWLVCALGFELGRRHQVRLGDRGIAPRRGQNEIDRRSALDAAKHDRDILVVEPDLLLPFAACYEMAGRDRHTLKRHLRGFA